MTNQGQIATWWELDSFLKTTAAAASEYIIAASTELSTIYVL